MANNVYTPPSIDEAPWLIAIPDNNNEDILLEKQTFCTMSPMLPKNKTYVKKIAELHGKYIVGSSLGWLILQEREDDTMFSLWNPVTSKSVNLPALLDAPEELPGAIFTSAPYEGSGEDANEACVLLLLYEGLVFFCRPMAKDDCRWAKQSIEQEGESVRFDCSVTVNGDIFACAQHNNAEVEYAIKTMIVRMKVADNGSESIDFEPSFVEFPDTDINFTPHATYTIYLVEVSGVLHLVHIILRIHDSRKTSDIYKALVWKLDLTQKKWIPVESLGNRAFLLSYQSSTWCWAPSSSNNNVLKDRIEADCIYVAKHYESVKSYSLRDDHYTCLLPHRNFSRFAITPTWFMPHPIDSRFLPSEDEETKEDVDVDVDVTTLGSSLLLQLPVDILLSIANRMHMFDQLNLRVTCKSFQSAIPIPKWRVDHRSYPFLISFDNKQGICELWDPFETTLYKKYIMWTPYSPNNSIAFESSKDGWLLLRIGRDLLEYYNPSTNERVKCPSCPLDLDRASHAFSTIPNNPDNLTLRTAGYDCLYVASFQAGSEKWIHEAFDNANFSSSGNYSNPIWFNGAFYMIGVNGKLGALELVDNEKWSWKLYGSPLTEVECEDLNSCYLIELDGQLTTVYFRQDGRRVQVFKFEISEESWTGLDDLGENVLFLSESSLSMVEKNTMKRNRIYLSKCAGNEIVYYSLDTRQYNTLSQKNPMESLHGVTTQPFWRWIDHLCI